MRWREAFSRTIPKCFLGSATNGLHLEASNHTSKSRSPLNESEEVMAKKKSSDVAVAEEPVNTGGHDFNDPEVVAADEKLKAMLLTLDNLGVVLDETEYRALSDGDKGLVQAWAELRSGGDLTVQCPLCLHPHAAKTLLAEFDQHVEVQEQNRKILVRCRFNKPTAVLPTGDETGDYIKMSMVIPTDDIQRTTVLKDFLVGKRVLAEFSLRSVDKWIPELPGAEQFPEIIACETEIKGLVWLMKGYRISFKVSCELIDDNTANRVYAKNNGSLRLTLLGDIEAKEKKAKEPKSISHGDHTPLPGQLALWNPGSETSMLVHDGEFTCPDEFIVPLDGDKDYALVSIGVGENRKFYASSDFHFIDKDGDEFDNDLGYPDYDPNKGYHSRIEAMKSEVGGLIDDAMKNNAPDAVVNKLKDCLKSLESGVELTPAPEEE